MNIRLLPLFLALLACAIESPLAAAQGADSREQEQIRRLRAQLQQVSRNLAEAQTAREVAERNLQELQAARAAVEREAVAEGAARRTLAIRLEQATEQTQRLNEVLSDTRRGLESRSSELAGANAEGERLRNELTGTRQRSAQLEHDLGQCVADNGALAGSARELLGLYAGKGVGEVLSAGEPVFGFGKVRVENLIERYGNNIAAHELDSKSRSERAAE